MTNPMTQTTKPNIKRLDELEDKIITLQLQQIQADTQDHEARIRTLEETATKVNTLMALVFGGGLLSAINLIVLLLSLSTK